MEETQKPREDPMWVAATKRCAVSGENFDKVANKAIQALTDEISDDRANVVLGANAKATCQFYDINISSVLRYAVGKEINRRAAEARLLLVGAEVAGRTNDEKPIRSIDDMKMFDNPDHKKHFT